MIELFDDTELRVAFRDFAGVTNPFVRPPGADRAEYVARGRIRTRRLVVVCAAALAVLVPAALVALAQVGGSSSMPPPPATDAPVTPTAPTRSSTPTATPTATATTPPPRQPTEGPGDLLNATLSLSWSDPSADEICGGTVTITETTDGLMVLSTMHLDVDGDGTNEIVAKILCPLGQVGPQQLIAVEPGVSPTVIGVVLQTADTDGAGELDPLDGPGVATIRGYNGLADGTIRADVGNKFTCCSTPPSAAVVQQRSYRWTGSSFEQIDGPTTFVADPAFADVTVTVPTLAFGAPVDGFRSATLTVTIHNDGPQNVQNVSAFLDYRFGTELPDGGDWYRCEPKDQITAVCAVDLIAPGQTVTLTLPMRRSSQFEAEETPHFSTNTGRVEVRIVTRTGTYYYPSVTFGLSAA